MKRFIAKYGKQIVGILKGWDRIPFRGTRARGRFNPARGTRYCLNASEVFIEGFVEHAKAELQQGGGHGVNAAQSPAPFVDCATYDAEAACIEQARDCVCQTVRVKNPGYQPVGLWPLKIYLDGSVVTLYIRPMSTRFVPVNRNQALLLPPDLRDWVPEDDSIHVAIRALDSRRTHRFRVNAGGTGSAQYPPSTMLSPLFMVTPTALLLPAASGGPRTGTSRSGT